MPSLNRTTIIIAINNEHKGTPLPLFFLVCEKKRKPMIEKKKKKKQ
jgi:hypothetical protein